MGELKFCSVKKIARKKKAGARFAGDFAGRAVKCVADDGMAESSHMDADLMGAANGVAADSGRDRAFVVLRPAVHEGEVSFLDAASCELSCQFAMGCVVLCDYDQATSFFVQTVDDAGTQLAADLGERAEAVQQ